MSNDYFEISLEKGRDLLTNKNFEKEYYIAPYGIAVLKVKGDKNDN